MYNHADVWSVIIIQIYSMKSGSLWNYYRDEINAVDDDDTSDDQMSIHI